MKRWLESKSRIGMWVVFQLSQSLCCPIERIKGSQDHYFSPPVGCFMRSHWFTWMKEWTKSGEDRSLYSGFSNSSLWLNERGDRFEAGAALSLFPSFSLFLSLDSANTTSNRKAWNIMCQTSRQVGMIMMLSTIINLFISTGVHNSLSARGNWIL